MKPATLALGLTLLCASHAQAATLVVIGRLDGSATTCNEAPFSSSLVGIDGQCTPTVEGSTKVDCATGAFDTFSNNACSGFAIAQDQACTEEDHTTTIMQCTEVDAYLVFTGTVGTCAAAGAQNVRRYAELGCRSYAPGTSTKVVLNGEDVTIEQFTDSISCDGTAASTKSFTVGECTEEYVATVAGAFSVVQPPATAPPTADATNATSNETGNATSPPTLTPTSGASLTSVALSGSMALISALTALAVF